MKKSIAKNSIFYMFYNILNMLFPFITSMYVARILLPVSIGEVAYAQNIVSYFSMLAFLGIPTYGVREIAKYRNEKAKLDQIYSELIFINFLSTVVFSIIYYLTIFIIPEFHKSFPLYAVVGITVILNMLNNSWLYEGLEEFRFISLRNAVFKILMFALVVFLVRNQTDVLSYAGISVFGIAGNNIINFLYARNYVSISFRNMNLKRHMKPILLLVIVNIAIEIYTLVDTTMLGIMTSKEHVAYYYYASKLNKVLLQITNTLTMVLVPRIALYYKEKKYAEFNKLLTVGMKVIAIIAVPMIIGLEFTAESIFTKLFGAAYISSAEVERILCFVVLISPIGYLLGSRVMLVANKEQKMVQCVGTGAVVNAVGNLILIQLFYEKGAAIASLISELVVMILYIYQGKKIFKLDPFAETFVKVLFAGGCEAFVLLLLNFISPANWLLLIVEIVVAAASYFICLLVLKEPIIQQYYSTFVNKIRS